MSEDWLVRAPHGIDLTDVVSALADLDPDLRVRADASRRHVVVVDAQDRPLVWIGLSVEAADPVEDATGLGLPLQGARERPWWTEVTGQSAQARLIGTVATRLADVGGGRADRLSGAPLASGTDQAPPVAADCPCDIVTDHVGVLLSSRPLVQATGWIVEAMSWAQRAGLRAVLLTPPGTRVTRSAWMFLTSVDAAWVVSEDDRFVDGMTGQPLDWEDGTFVLVEGEQEQQEARAEVRMAQGHTRHAYGREVRVGDFARTLADAVGIPAPTGHGGLEPMERQWDPEYLTELAVGHSPGPFSTMLRGPGMRGRLTVQPQPSFVQEHAELWADAAQCEPLTPVEILTRCLDAGVRHVVLVRQRAASAVDVSPRPVADSEVVGLIAHLADLPELDHTALVDAAGPDAEFREVADGTVFVLGGADRSSRPARSGEASVHDRYLAVLPVLEAGEVRHEDD